MKKISRKQYFFIGLLSLITVYTIAREAHIIGFYRAPADSMMPNYAPNELLFTFRWANIDRGDVVAFHDISMPIPGYRKAQEDIFMGRIVAMGGDQFEIANGQVFINGSIIRPEKPIQFFWVLSQRAYQENARRFDSPAIPYLYDSVYVALQESKAVEIQKTIPMRLLDTPVFHEGIENIWGEEGLRWTANNFGPVTIPEDCLFIMGDNRCNSEDSRHRGFVPIKDVIGKVIY